ncbi:SagB/ThcOx family dehydrogenase [Clostridium sp. OS1-26]|uniref:SagB/ThcOx family dehydrogenase n=1 Tax=Clostridium sp. OS1-26 TaxID=3070681 RepID=UPI0027E1DFDB|nr:SagB/ThcOx family dehydrogenase [Clostridium sp. OS1-26]WML37394.1 SagB/ThcOx family dehydrogenase [Clostridium sp. OS1-26]
MNERFKINREFLKANFQVLDDIKTDIQKGIPGISPQKKYDKALKAIELPEVKKDIISKNNVFDCLKDRRSVRKYSCENLTLEELSFLLWATQGVHKIIGNGPASLRTVPSGGASHTFETYLFINRVDSLEQGVYRYLPFEHKLIFIDKLNDMENKVNLATPRQPFVPNFASKGAVIFAWSSIPYRAEWKFDITAHKKILIDIGHVCQNLYIACEAIKCGTCAIGIYNQEFIDKMLGLDGENEFVIYMASVGK